MIIAACIAAVAYYGARNRELEYNEIYLRSGLEYRGAALSKAQDIIEVLISKKTMTE